MSTPEHGEPNPRDQEQESAADAPKPTLPTALRIGIYFAGWLFLFVGLVGLALPGIQGLLTIALGASLLSLVSEAAHRRMRAMLRPWPKGRHYYDGLRSRLHAKFERFRRHR